MIIFDRHQSLEPQAQIINYYVSPDNKWCLLGEVSTGSGGMVLGNMQFFSVKKKIISTTDRFSC